MISNNNFPQHIAIIMDGNGRWATTKGLPRILGHRAGAEALKKLIEDSKDLPLKYLTVYAFSTENWKRPEEEVNGIMSLLVEFTDKELEKINKSNIKIVVLGEIQNLPPKTKESVLKAIQTTRFNNGLQINIALNYGGRQEIIQAIGKIKKDILEGVLKDEIDEKTFRKYLYTKELPDPELVIRTSGEYRLSNFLLWQTAYSEFYFLKKYWPDFTIDDLKTAITSYAGRNRRFGNISKQSR